MDSDYWLELLPITRHHVSDVPEPSHSCSLKRCVLPGPACQERPRLLLVLEVTVRPLTADGSGHTTQTGTLLLM